MPVSVRALDLVKTYRNGVKAVDNVSFEAGPGITMLMGPNGSGKTTTLLMIAGALKPSSGKVYIGEYDLWGIGWREARELIGFAPQSMPFKEKLTVLENMVWYGLLRGLGISESRRRGKELLGIVGLGGYEKTLVGRLSSGMRKRLSIAAALIGDPPVLVLDEPTSGLDLQARRRLLDLLKSLSRNRCVITSTHIPYDAEEYADKVIVFHAGRIVANGNPAELVAKYSPHSLIYLEGRIVEAPDVEGASLIHRKERAAIYSSEAPSSTLPRLLEALIAKGSRIDKVEIRRPGLGEVYLRLTGYSLEEGEAG